VTGIQAASTATLETIRGNLLQGLDLIADHIAAGTFHDVGAKGKAPPSQSGQITLWLYYAVTAELVSRTEGAT
jgi:hypothetical protein